MAKYTENPYVIEAVTFEEVMAEGKKEIGTMFNYAGKLIEYKSEQSAIVNTTVGPQEFTAKHIMVIGDNNQIIIRDKADFLARYTEQK